jgi:2,3-bisphosphoglycerate-independent phosphoglycerate mutase
MTPESDNALLSILGYDPKIYLKGRSPLEAVSMGLEMRDADTAFRCNLVSLADNHAGSDSSKYADKIILDHSADNISTEEAGILIRFLHEKLGSAKRRFYAGVSYRHCVLWENCPPYTTGFMRPHDILDKRISEYLPRASEYSDLMRESYDLLNEHPVNVQRRKNNKKPANSIWLWSPGIKMSLPSFKDKYNLESSVIAAVDLIKGIGISAGMRVVKISGTTGDFHTNYKGKGEAAVKELENGKDLVFVHIEAPDECSHQGNIDEKIKSIELIDADIIEPVFKYLDANHDDFKILIMPDHPTPLALRTHTSEPVPFLFYDKKNRSNSGISNFCESGVSEKSKIFIEDGSKLLEFILNRRNH